MAVATARGGIVAKKQPATPKKLRGEGRLVRIDPELFNKARIVALRRGSPIGEYIAGLIDVPVNRDYQRVLKELASEAEGGGK
jgi:hypothetical protein